MPATTELTPGIESIISGRLTTQNPEELRRWLGLSQHEFAASLGLSRSTVARWALRPPLPISLRGRSRRALGDAFWMQFLLEDLVGRDEAVQWLRRPNRGFEGKTPLDVMMSGDLQRVVYALDIVASGGEF